MISNHSDDDVEPPSIESRFTMLTSGTTGTPKGVMLTHANVASQVEAIEQVVRLTPRDVLIGILPFFHR